VDCSGVGCVLHGDRVDFLGAFAGGAFFAHGERGGAAAFAGGWHFCVD
jgi:hypothetical protein